MFVGTTNKDQYLRDETGGRRFWPALCGIINIEALARDRDQLLAEAVHRFKQNEPWWPDKTFEQDIIAPEQAARYEADEVWEAAIGTYINSRTKVTVGEIAKFALLMDQTGKISRADQNRIMAVLTRAGWRRGERTLAAPWWVKG